MYLNFGVPLALTIIGIGFVALMFGLQKLLAPQNPYDRKLIPYECGEPPTGRAWINFNVRFYLIALIFVVFEVEVAFVYPVAAVYLDWVRSGRRWYALSEILVFLLILFVGLVYVWVNHDLGGVNRVPVETVGFFLMPLLTTLPEHVLSTIPDAIQKRLRHSARATVLED